MNKNQKKELDRYRDMIEQARDGIDMMAEEERGKLDNLEDRNVYEGDLHESLEQAADTLEGIRDNLDDALSAFDELP